MWGVSPSDPGRRSGCYRWACWTRQMLAPTLLCMHWLQGATGGTDLLCTQGPALLWETPLRENQATVCSLWRGLLASLLFKSSISPPSIYMHLPTIHLLLSPYFSLFSSTSTCFHLLCLLYLPSPFFTLPFFRLRSFSAESIPGQKSKTGTSHTSAASDVTRSLPVRTIWPEMALHTALPAMARSTPSTVRWESTNPFIPIFFLYIICEIECFTYALFAFLEYSFYLL